MDLRLVKPMPSKRITKLIRSPLANFLLPILCLVQVPAGLAETQKEFRESPPMPIYEHPYYWAAFQLSGDWGTVEGL